MGCERADSAGGPAVHGCIGVVMLKVTPDLESDPDWAGEGRP
jgi:hypothetical protein